MDDSNRRRRQIEPPYQSQSSSDRYRPPALSTSPAVSRGAGAATAYQAYYQDSSTFPAAIPPNPLQYQSSAGYGQEQRQQQNFAATYNTDIMYNVAQQAPQSNNLYDSSAASHFQGRQSAGMQMLSDATPYFSGEAAAAPVPPLHQASSGSTAVYQQHQHSPADRAPLLQQAYSNNLPMANLSSAAEIMDEDDFQSQGPGMEAAYTAYQTALKEIFRNIINSRLGDASQSLLEVSEWLLGHVGDLGLTVDEVALRSDRIRLWGEFNTAWLSIFQKQKELIESGQRIQLPQSIMTQEFINKMAKDLIRMCDAVEKYGLVDYQYGVAEEQIISIITECLDLQESIEGIDSGGSGHTPSLSRAPP